MDWFIKDNDMQSTTEIDLNGLLCSSSNMLNTLIDVLGRTIDEEQGLKKISVNHFKGQNSL